MKQLDDAVATGKITDQEGISYLKQVAIRLSWAAKYLSGLATRLVSTWESFGRISTLLILLSDDFAYRSIHANRPGSSASTINAPGSVTDAYGTAPIRSTTDPSFAYKPSLLPPRQR